ncbi:peptide/nickel transport system substrate-binding protein [Halalkaliarchaeum desulfuricum]|uniref:Peptide/nickel transport system substrate-binding protein n=1 Tax=Halalkaliarchaeum desulfuricum TaxID=2055893 RepID=A0A343TNC8_9EURY|nr:ABC transporter substrate-binding protein [Halalkaliarchaeum desulfuricum]AUX10600.1 peptide/nickel transport system substrate-binding protein [Halalkaliarchaeum desulfuricum]
MTDLTAGEFDRRTVLQTTAAAGILGVAGCLGGDERAALHVGSPWGIDRDPLESGYALRRVGITEALVGVSHDVEPTPSLATDWEQVTQTRWEFTLREGVTFHDGRQLDARTALPSLRRAASSNAFANVPVRSVEAVDDVTIAIETETPFAPLLAHMSRHEAVVLSPDALDDDPIEPIGTGPFVFDSLETGAELRARRNEEYHGTVPSVESVRYEVVEDDQTRRLKLENGELEMARILPQEFVADLEAADGIDVYTPTIPRLRFLTFDTQSAPFDDSRVRRAVTHGIDRAAITESVLEGIDDPVGEPIPPVMSSWADPDVDGPQYDPERADDLLSTAGWTTGSDGTRTNGDERLSVDCYTYDARSLPLIGEVLQSQLADIGIEFELAILEYGTMVDRISRDPFDAYLTSWNWHYPDPDRLTDLFHSAGALQHGWNNDRVDRLLEEARASFDPEIRRQKYHAVQSAVLDDVPIAVLTGYTNVIATSADVRGYDPHPAETQYGLEHVNLEGK